MREAKDIRTVLAGTGLPVAYRTWKEGEGPEPPFCVYYAERANNMAADGIVYWTAQRYTVGLYTDRKEPETEKLVENALTEAGIYWTKDETYIASERLIEIIYEIEV